MKKQTRAENLREASQKRRQQEKEDLRHAIMQAASELFLEHGYEAFSLRQIAEKIGYAPGTIYLYFQDKDAILFTIMEEGLKVFTELFLEAAKVENPKEQLLSIAKAYIEFGIKHPAYYQLMFMQRTDYLLRYQNAEVQPFAIIFGTWAQVIEAAMQAGVLRMGNPESTGDALWGLLHGVVSLAILMPIFDEKRRQAMLDNALELMEKGFYKN